ncbi:MAG: TraB/GumN family protein [Mariprofundaceae bacterium]
MPELEGQDQPLVQVELEGRKVTLLGTAHVSKASAEAVDRLITSGHYDAVAVELCASRHSSIVNPDALEKMDLFRVIRDGKASMVAASLALGAFQQRMADEVGIRPGEEMRTAIGLADEHDLPLLLIDREVGTTLKRIYRNVPWWKRMNLVSGLIATVVSHEKVSEEEIERLKEGDILEGAFAQFADEEKELFKPLIDERDQFMAARILQEAEQGKHLLAIVGAGHLKGIQRYLDQGLDIEATLERLNSLPPSGSFLKYLPWIITAFVLTGFAIGFSRSPDLGWELVRDWVLINGGLSALGALIAAAHPLTIITAFVAAPLTSLNPMVGAGMVTGAVETWVRRPHVADFRALRSDTTHVKGWWKNRVTRILLVFMLSTFGSAIGTYVAGFMIYDKLAG